MEHKPLTKWYCDHCDLMIENPADGLVIWNGHADLGDHDFKVVHKGICDDKSYGKSLPINDFLGYRGQAKLLSLLSDGRLKTGFPFDSSHYHATKRKVKNRDEYVDLFRRFQLPYYEEARRYFEDVEIRDMFDSANEIAPYKEEALEAILLRKGEL